MRPHWERKSCTLPTVSDLRGRFDLPLFDDYALRERLEARPHAPPRLRCAYCALPEAYAPVLRAPPEWPFAYRIAPRSVLPSVVLRTPATVQDPVVAPPVEPVAARAAVSPVTARPPVDPATDQAAVSPVTARPPVDPATDQAVVSPAAARTAVPPVVDQASADLPEAGRALPEAGRVPPAAGRVPPAAGRVPPAAAVAVRGPAQDPARHSEQTARSPV